MNAAQGDGPKESWAQKMKKMGESLGRPLTLQELMDMSEEYRAPHVADRASTP